MVPKLGEGSESHRQSVVWSDACQRLIAHGHARQDIRHYTLAQVDARLKPSTVRAAATGQSADGHRHWQQPGNGRGHPQAIQSLTASMLKIS